MVFEISECPVFGSLGVDGTAHGQGMLFGEVGDRHSKSGFCYIQKPLSGITRAGLEAGAGPLPGDLLQLGWEYLRVPQDPIFPL